MAVPRTVEPEEAKAFLSNPAFRRVFELPASPTDGRDRAMQFTYADFGYRNEEHPEQENVMVFLAPLMSSRMLHVAKIDLARRHKVRVISMDRPGFGGSEEVPIAQRLDTSRAALVELLKHLGIRHVSVGCHSAGTIYAFDLIFHHPELLHPERPYLAIGAPWIHPSHTNVMTMAISNMLPVTALAQFDKVVHFFNTRLAPVTGASVGVSQAMSSLFARSTPTPGDSSDDTQFELAIFPKLIDYVHTENIHGLSQETVVAMQKLDATAGWGTWGDYDTLGPRLAEALRSLGRRLSIEVFFAETDTLIGDAGTPGLTWFMNCWKSDQEGWPIECHSEVVQGADHNTIWEMSGIVVPRVLEKVGAGSSASD